LVNNFSLKIFYLNNSNKQPTHKNRRKPHCKFYNNENLIKVYFFSTTLTLLIRIFKNAQTPSIA
jgi:hypothetical protein